LAQTAMGFVSRAALRRHSWLILSQPPSGSFRAGRRPPESLPRPPLGSFRAAGIEFVSPDGPPGVGGINRGKRPALADHSSLPTDHCPLTTPERPPALGPAPHPAGRPAGRPTGARRHHHHRLGSAERPEEPSPLDDERIPHAATSCPP
jgi:hypothetical protein